MVSYTVVKVALEQRGQLCLAVLIEMNSNFVYVGFGWLRALNPQPASHCTQRIVLNGCCECQLKPCLGTLIGL